MSLFSILEAMLDVVVKYWHRLLLYGLGITILLAVVAVIGGTLLGTVVAVGRMSKYKVLRGVITAYVEVLKRPCICPWVRKRR